MREPNLIKVSGHQINDPQFLTQLAAYVAESTAPVIIVHGGGAEITQMQQVMGIEPRYVDGLRVTDADTLAMVEMVLCGVVNKRLVRYLLQAGVDAIGLSGVDRGLVRAEPISDEMGFTGRVASVRAEVIGDLLERGLTPVIAPVCLGPESNLNVNADEVTGAVAAAAGVGRVMFVTNVSGVKVDDEWVPTLTGPRAEQLIADGVIFGGMIPKVQAALSILAAGVPQVAICDLDGLQSGGGTVFVTDDEPIIAG
jgi:acetylglutamate kinase